MTQSIRYPKSQVRVGPKNLDADRVVVEKIFLSAHDKFNLYDNSHTSRAPQTIRSIVEGKGFGFGFGARIVGNDIFVDFMRHKSQSPKFDEIHDFILTELKNAFKMEFEEIWDDQPNYCSTH